MRRSVPIGLVLLLDMALIAVGAYFIFQFMRLSSVDPLARVRLGEPRRVFQEDGQIEGRDGGAANVQSAGKSRQTVVAPGTAKTALRPQRARQGSDVRSKRPEEGNPSFGGVRSTLTGGGDGGTAQSGAEDGGERSSEPPSLATPIDAESVQLIVRQHHADIRTCYSRGLKTNPEASGVIEIGFVVTQEGRAARQRIVTDTVGLPGVAECIAGHLGRWQFPRPVGGEVEFVYPFILSPAR